MALTKVTTGGITDATIATADIADQAITLDKLPHGTSSNNGKFLRANNGADPSFETVTSTTINNNADNRVITGSGTANTLNGESNVVIDSSGNLGIGAGTPRQKLHISASDSSSANMVFTNSTTGTSSGDGFIVGITGGEDAQLNMQESANLKFSTADTERMRISSGGNVGINPDANGPDRLLHVSDSNAGGVVTPFRLTNVAGTNGTEVRMEFECGLDEIAWIGAKNEGSDTGPLTFATASSQGAYPTEKMRLTKDGRVGIGTDSPSAMLHVYKVHHYVPTDSGKATGGIHVRGQNGNAGEYGGGISFSCGDADSSSAIAVSQEAQDSDVTGLGFFVHESSDGSHDAVERLRINNKGLVQAKGRAGNYFGAVASNEYHVFNNTGNGKFVMQLHQEHHGGHGLRLRQGANNNNEAMDIVDYSNSGVQRFKISNNGDVKNTNNSYGSLSDISLKENIVDAKSQWNDIKAIKVRNFNFKETPDKKLLGVVAQEIETVCSGLVTEENVKDPDDTSKITGTVKSVKYSVLYMKAIKALQEAITRIEALEAKVA